MPRLPLTPSSYPFVLALTLLALAALMRSSAPAAAAAGKIDFRDCDRGWQCGTIAVPVDYEHPGGRTVDVAVARLPARDPARRLGILLTNPGGPGAGGIGFARSWARALDGEIRDRFDIVAFDPRGTGGSEAVTCDDHLVDLFGVDQSPDTQAEFDTLVGLARDYARSCRQQYADLIDHLGTRNVARDMDRIREALGEDRVSFVGYSYGTRLGAVYADLFPGRVRAFVLDGAVDNSLTGEQATLEQAAGFERALRNFLEDCRQKGCSLADGGDPYEAVRSAIDIAAVKPIPAPAASRPAREGEVMLGIAAALYDQSTWPLLRSALENALDGNASTLVTLADAYLRSASTAVLYAVNCADTPASSEPIDTFDKYRAALPRFEAASPTFGPTVVIDFCQFWGGTADPVGVPDANGTPPIVVIGTTGDPATPYEWAVALAGQLDSGVLVTYEGEGHTVYGGRNGCIDRLVNAFLIDPATSVPADGATCGNVVATPQPPATGGPVEPGRSSALLWVLAFVAIAVAGTGLIAVRLWRTP